MPKFWDSETLVILPGTGVQVDWGPDFGDPADDNSWTARGTINIDDIDLDATIIVLCTLILAISITATFNLTAIGDLELDNVHARYTGPWTATGDIDGNLTPLFEPLILAAALDRIIGPSYSHTCQCAPRFDTLAANYTGPWTARGSLSGGGSLAATFTGPWTVLGTLAFVIGPTYTRTCQCSIVADTLQLAHTKTCACAARISAEAITYTGPWTCNADVGQLNYELDFVGAATGINIDITVPTGANSMFSEVWSGGGGGGTALVNGGGGGGGGGFASDTEPVAAGTTITVQVGAGGAVGAAGGLSIVSEAGTTRCRATGGGAGGNGGAGGQGAAGARGDATNGDTLRDGGLGGGGGGVQLNGGGGGGGSGTANAGGNGAANRTAGTGGANLGGDGGIGGGGVGAPSAAGSQRGGGGGGASTTNGASAGARGGVRINFTIPTP